MLNYIKKTKNFINNFLKINLLKNINYNLKIFKKNYKLYFLIRFHKKYF